jgi:hypothetical protein
MNYKELTEKLGREPAQIFEDFYGIASASPEAFFLKTVKKDGISKSEKKFMTF